MKELRCKTVYLRPAFLILFFLMCISAVSASESETIEIRGVVRDAKSGKKLENVAVSLLGSNIGTVSNSDGFFILKIPADSFNEGIQIDHLGYLNEIITLNNIQKNADQIDIFLTPTGKVLDELLVYGGDPREIVIAALNKIPENYSDKNNLFTGFYRETLRKGSRYINISEGLIEVLKRPYTQNRNISGEKVRIKKGRVLSSQRLNDTLSVKLMGGPNLAIMLDAVKNGEHLFSEDELYLFDFKMETPVNIDERPHYVIAYNPNYKNPVDYPLYRGRLFIDAETLAISKAEFELDLKDKSKVTRAILQKKPRGLRFKPLEISGVVTYKLSEGKSYINYIRSTIRFKCDWKRRLFSSSYTSQSEMVMVDRIDNVDRNLKFEDTFKNRNIFSDRLSEYWDEDFWKDYNIIEPSESLEKAVDKLRAR